MQFCLVLEAVDAAAARHCPLLAERPIIWLVYCTTVCITRVANRDARARAPNAAAHLGPTGRTGIGPTVRLAR